VEPGAQSLNLQTHTEQEKSLSDTSPPPPSQVIQQITSLLGTTESEVPLITGVDLGGCPPVHWTPPFLVLTLKLCTGHPLYFALKFIAKYLRMKMINIIIHFTHCLDSDWLSACS